MRKKGYVITIFLLLLAFSVLSYFLFTKTPLKKANGITELLFSPFQHIVVGAKTPLTRDEKIDALQKENASLQAQIVKLQIAKKEMEALKDQFHESSIPSRKLTPAKIVSMRTFLPGITRPDAIIIDKGSADGIQKGRVVLSQDTVLGQVVEVSEHVSLVQLLSAPKSSVTGETTETHALGILHGGGNGTIRLENVLLSDTLEKNDLVITKGDVNQQGSGIPPGMLIGKIESVRKKASDLFQSAEVSNAIDVAKLAVVFILD